MNQAFDSTCPHCDPNSFAIKHLLAETERFRIVCDVHPLVEGHLLIIPKAHLSCIGTYDRPTMVEFMSIYDRCLRFVGESYGSVATFEHGNTAQTVFHSHIHLLPYQGTLDAIVPEGTQYLNEISGIDDLHPIFERDGKFLFFSIGEQDWTVDVSLSKPRFFRDRFAVALNHPERGNWKQMREDASLMAVAEAEIARTTAQFRAWSDSH